MMTKQILNASEMGKLGGRARAAKLTKEQLSAIGKKAVQAREAKRALSDAHMPTWIKATIAGLQSGTSKGSYRILGRKIGGNIDDYTEDFDVRFSEKELKEIARWDGFEQRHELLDGVRPTSILCRIFASERHPDGRGDLVLQIPKHQRGNYLAGIIDGVVEDR